MFNQRNKVSPKQQSFIIKLETIIIYSIFYLPTVNSCLDLSVWYDGGALLLLGYYFISNAYFLYRPMKMVLMCASNFDFNSSTKLLLVFVYPSTNV